MSLPLSALLLREINQEPDVGSDIANVIDVRSEIVINSEIIPGFRENSYVVWIPEEQQLYYRKRILKNGTQSCTCTVDGCNAKVFIKIDGTAYKNVGQKHRRHANAYEEYRMTSCFNKMKHKAKTAPVCMDPFDIYTEVIKE